MLIPMVANDGWSLVVSDELTDGRRLRILTVVDDCARKCLRIIADTSLSGLRVAHELDRVIKESSMPRMIVSDDGNEFTSNAILQWTDRSKVVWHRRSSRLSPMHDPRFQAGAGITTIADRLRIR